MQSLLKSLAQIFSNEFIAQAETRAEKLGSSLGVMSDIFSFMSFVVMILVIVGGPIDSDYFRAIKTAPATPGQQILENYRSFLG